MTMKSNQHCVFEQERIVLFVLLLGDIVGRQDNTEMEDMFPNDYYLRFVNAEYAKALGGTELTLNDISKSNHPQIVHRVYEVFKARGLTVNSEGKAFNKGRIAKKMLTELQKTNFEDLPEEVIWNFRRLFEGINNAMPNL